MIKKNIEKGTLMQDLWEIFGNYYSIDDPCWHYFNDVSNMLLKKYIISERNKEHRDG